MVIRKIIIYFYLSVILFLLHSLYNVYTNLIDTKIIDVSTTINLSAIPFPLQIQIVVEQNLDTLSSVESGFDNEYVFYLPFKEKQRGAFKNKNMTGQFIIYRPQHKI